MFDFVIEDGVLLAYHGPDGDVVIPDGVREIGAEVFQDRLYITSVTLPESVKKIGKRAFSGCEGLADEHGFVIVGNVLFDYIGTGGNVVIPEGVTRIGHFAFYGCLELKNVVFPKRLKVIDDHAFHGCSCLEKIRIPNGVARIGAEAFSGCRSLSSIQIPESVVEIGSGAFSLCSGLEDGQKMIIVRGVLYGYTGNDRVAVIPDGVREISKNGFLCSRELQKVIIPESVVTIADSAFKECDGLADENGLVIIRDVLYDCLQDKEKVVVPEGVKRISDHGLERCARMRSVILPEGLTEIGAYAFYACRSLKEVVVPASVKKIGDRAFLNCFQLESVTIRGDKTELGYEVIAECYNIESVACPSMKLEDHDMPILMYCAAMGFVEHRELYKDPEVIRSCENLLLEERRVFLPVIFKRDLAEGLALYAKWKRITAKLFEAEYLIPAQRAGAKRCVEFLLQWKAEHLSTPQ